MFHLTQILGHQSVELAVLYIQITMSCCECNKQGLFDTSVTLHSTCAVEIQLSLIKVHSQQLTETE